MARPMDTLPTSLEASPFGLSIQRGKESVFLFGVQWRTSISVAMDWPSGWDSSVANAERDQGYLASSTIYLSGRDWNTGWSRQRVKNSCVAHFATSGQN